MALADDPTYHHLYVEDLAKKASWIRDILDPMIAYDGPDVLGPNDVLELHELFRSLRKYPPTSSALKLSRIHFAVLEVSGKATRWPSRLAFECDEVITTWEKKYGPLRELRPSLFVPGGRLYGICSPHDITREALLSRFNKDNPGIPFAAFEHGDLGFKPGDWWINALFAYRSGIINSEITDGGICADDSGAYAILMKEGDESEAFSADEFTYKCRIGDRGRYRLCAADYTARYPIRILRAHSLMSLWSPRAGVRYEGLYTVSGWRIRPADPKLRNGETTIWEVMLRREEDQIPFREVMLRPKSHEIDDYMEYKRTRRVQRDRIRHGDADRISQAGDTEQLRPNFEQPASSPVPTITEPVKKTISLSEHATSMHSQKSICSPLPASATEAAIQVAPSKEDESKLISKVDSKAPQVASRTVNTLSVLKSVKVKKRSKRDLQRSIDGTEEFVTHIIEECPTYQPPAVKVTLDGQITEASPQEKEKAIPSSTELETGKVARYAYHWDRRRSAAIESAERTRMERRSSDEAHAEEHFRIERIATDLHRPVEEMYNSLEDPEFPDMVPECTERSVPPLGGRDTAHGRPSEIATYRNKALEDLHKFAEEDLAKDAKDVRVEFREIDFGKKGEDGSKRSSAWWRKDSTEPMNGNAILGQISEGETTEPEADPEDTTRGRKSSVLRHFSWIKPFGSKKSSQMSED
ncbi:hypothetical protein M501DRAFT_1013028 [Patellaria atrata CBS 101060]|uniref:YDG domain-containing protein n=1 Tax=Patellaria atrata CBS 101060 TaxID=1346257 RepID=A0A9P4VXD0_9PEZI|nr:hypothetical protein M501DRAFT_1013028 [Patellaria atrata CBS 101060]